MIYCSPLSLPLHSKCSLGLRRDPLLTALDPLLHWGMWDVFSWHGNDTSTFTTTKAELVVL